MALKENKAPTTGFWLTVLSVALFVLLAVLKLTGIITVSWLWVLAPIAIPFAIVWACIGLAYYLLSVDRSAKNRYNGLD